ncbi:MAG: PilZ domain-containing protein [Myxococcales bacterium]|nr:PilZ domain-containing protein [Myxococcales bacterium]
MASNRRRWPRVRAQGVAAHLRAGQDRTQCQVENVSLGGLFVRTDRMEEVGAEIFVDLVRPGWKKQLSLAARITSRVEALDGRIPGLGLQFLRVDGKQHERLRQLLRELGAPDEEPEITLPEEESEEELRALDLDWKQVQKAAASVQDAIESALRDANVPPPQPLVEERPRASAFAPQGPGQEDLGTINARLTVQIRGLVMQLSDAQRQLAGRNAEIERLKDELDIARRALERAVRKG